MDDGHFSRPSPALEALAVLGKANSEAVSALLQGAVTGAAWQAVTRLEGVSGAGEWLAVDPAAAAEVLQRMEREQPARYRELHRRAARLLADKLQAGSREWEPMFTTFLERWGSDLLNDDPDEFVAFTETIAPLPLHEPPARQWRDYFAALSHFKQDRFLESLDTLDALLAEPDLRQKVRARALNAHAVCCRLLGRLEEAAAGYRASLALWQALGDGHYEAVVRKNMGIIAYTLQNYAEAERLLQQAAALFAAADNQAWLATVYNELGLVQRDQGRWEAALQYFDRFIARRQAEGADEHVALGLLNKGEVRLFQGRLAEGEALLQQALATMRTNVYRVDVYLHLGLAYQAQERPAEAQKAFAEALALGQEMGRREILPHAHYRLGDLLWRQGKTAAALQQLEAAAALIEESRAPLHDEGLKISLLGRWQQIYEALVLHNLALGQAREALHWTEVARARAFAEGVARGEAAGAAELEEIQAGLGRGELLISFFTSGVLEQSIPLLRKIDDDNPLRASLLLPGRVIRFVVGRDTLEATLCALDPNLLATASPRGQDPRRFLAPAIRRTLREALLPDKAVEGASTITLMPHGPLHHVPFAALLPDEQLLSYAPSATIWRQTRQRRRGPGAAKRTPSVALAYGGQPALRYVNAEARDVARLTGGKFYLDGEMGGARLRQVARQARLLHFACHGRFNHERPLESYLQVGPDERLTAAEIMEGWRLQADLVTLSACQTGVSRILRGDEPMGLIRAFLYAGAAAVLVTQWAVEDLPTFLFVKRFYGLRQQGAGGRLGETLRQAQRWLQKLSTSDVEQLLHEAELDAPPAWREERTTGEKPFADPRHWAGFILVGDE